MPSQVVAYGRKTGSQAAVVIVNRSQAGQIGAIPVAGFLPDGVKLKSAYTVGTGGPASLLVSNGELTGAVGPRSAVVLVTDRIDLNPPQAPTGLTITEGDSQLDLAWNGTKDAAGYNLYRSPVSGGGWVKLNISPLAATSFTDAGLRNGQAYYYVVTSLDSAGNESANSNEASGLPHLTIGWANLQWPPTLNHTISVVNRTDNVYGQVWIDGVTSQPGPTPGLRAQLGFGPAGSNPDDSQNWIWADASFNVDAGNNDEFFASLLPEITGSFDYVYRYSTTNGRDWLYADLNGPIPTGSLPPNPGKLTVNSSGDTTPPAAPTGLVVTGASPSAISLDWDAHPNPDGDLAGFEVYRNGGLLARIIDAAAAGYTDTSVVENATYNYYIIALDTSFNRSGPSNGVTATAAPRTVSVTFNVTVPAWTPADQSVHIAGTLSRFDGSLPDWDSAAVGLTSVGSNQWAITLTGTEGVQIEYKYTLGTPDFFDVEKDGVCGEIPNRLLTLSYGSNGTMLVNDTVLNWRNVAPCGN